MAIPAPQIPSATSKSVSAAAPPERGASVTVRFEPSGLEVRVVRGTSLFEAARRAGLPIASACGRSAACGRCGVRVLESGHGIRDESDRERVVKARNRVDQTVRLSCMFSVRSDLTVTASYW